MISIRAAIHAHLAGQRKSWATDRAQTIGASEIGQCARKVWFNKNGVAPDPGTDQLKGAAHRGDLIERHLWVPAVTAHVEAAGGVMLFAGDDQTTLVDGYLSATPDGIAVFGDEALPLECKSIDPRVDLRRAKEEHFFQVQVQLGLIRHATRFKPDRAVLSYVDASFHDDVKEFVIEFDPAIYANAKARALRIMDAGDASALRPEGALAGGKECDRCEWAGKCRDAVRRAFPDGNGTLAGNAEAALETAASEAVQAAAEGKAAALRESAARETIKEILRTHGVRRVETDAVSVSYATVKGRTSLDTAAVAAAGIDLSPFNREGDPSERLTIKSKDQEA